MRQRLDSLDQRLQEILPLGWVAGHGTRIEAVIEQVRPEAGQLAQDVFAKLDPRDYWDEAQRREKISQGLKELTDASRRERILERLEEIAKDIQDGRGIAWTRDNRQLIENSYRDLNYQLDEIAREADVDPRKSFEEKWNDITNRSQHTLSFLDEIADTRLTEFQTQFDEIARIKHDLFTRSWPEDPQEKAAIRQSVKDLESRTQRLFEVLDPREAWLNQHKDTETEILRAIKSLVAKGDPDATTYQTDWRRLQERKARLENRKWTPQEQPAIIQEIKGLRTAMRSLRDGVIRDPRQQIDWDRIINQIEAEVSTVRHQGVSGLAAITDDFETSRGQIQRLRDLPWDPARESEMVQEIDDALRGLREIYTQVLRAQDELEGVSSKTINGAWRRGRDELISEITDLTTLQAKVDGVRHFLRERVDQLPRGIPDHKRPSHWRQEQAIEIIGDTREAVLTQAMQSFRLDDHHEPGIDENRWSAAIQVYSDWHAQFGSMMEQLRSIELALNNGYGLDHPVAVDSPSIREIYAHWLGQRASEYPFQVASIFESIAQRIERLMEIGDSFDRSRLLTLAQEGKQASDPAVTIAAWRKLGELTAPYWPGDIEELKEEQTIDQWLNAIVIQDTDQKRMLQTELESERYRRWERCLAMLTGDPAINAAVELFTQSRMDTTRVKPWAQYNILLSRFRAEIHASDPSMPESQLQDKMRVFVEHCRSLPIDVTSQTGVEKFLEDLEQLLKDDPVDQDAGDLSKVGPRSSPLWAVGTWDEQPADDQGWIRYEWNYKKTNHRLTFVRVSKTGPNPGSFYLCTSEVSLGLFRDAVSGTDRWSLFSDLLGNPPWVGPRGWVWRSTTNKAKGIKKNKNWTDTQPMLQSSGGGEHPDYFGSYTPDKPDYQHPMQYVSPEAAFYFAQLLGCRFATASEWRDALQLQTKGLSVDRYIDEPLNRPNLRDTVWDNQRGHVQDLERQAVMVEKLLAPYSGSLWQQKNGEVWPYDDKVLWFDTVESPQQTRPFVHLLGNVAEFVFDGPQDQLDLAPNVDGQAAKAAVKQQLDQGQLAVIGGSAQSPKSQPLDQARSIDHRSYSDVGIRLAFSAPRDPLLAKLRVKLDQQEYLTTDAQTDDKS